MDCVIFFNPEQFTGTGIDGDPITLGAVSIDIDPADVCAALDSAPVATTANTIVYTLGFDADGNCYRVPVS